MGNNKVKIGLVGLGYWGQNLVRNSFANEAAEVLYICDIDKKRLLSTHASYPSAKITQDYFQIVNDPELDAIILAVPTDRHYILAREALVAGKSVLIEKPMTSNSSEANDLINLAKEKNKTLMVDHTFEYNEAIKKIKEVVDSRELGEIFYIRAEWLNLGLLQPDINVVWDLGPHIISILNYLLGSYPRKVSANVKGYIRKTIPEIADIHLSYLNNVSAFVTLSWLEPKKTRRLTIIGDKKLLVYDLTNEEEPIKIYNKSVDIINNTNDVTQFKVNYKYGDIISPYLKNKESLSNMINHFIESVQLGGKPKTSGESGLRVVQVLEAIDKSSNENGKETFVENDS